MRYHISQSAAWRNVDGHIFVITEDSRQHELVGEVESLVWRLVDDQPRNRGELLSEIVESFAIDGDRAAADLDNFIGLLVDAGIFEMIS